MTRIDPIMAESTAASTREHGTEPWGGKPLKVVKDWHIDGVTIHFNRGCEAGGLGVMDTRRALLQTGIPVMTFEGSGADERDLDEARIISRVDSFMESLDLKHLHH